jgi:hypothetical protein
MAMSAQSRASITYGLGLLSGALLFFLIFGAVFVGSWLLLLVVLLGYAVAGALGVRIGGVAPGSMAIALAAPAVPWVLWLFPAAAAEEGLLRALPWPGLALAAAGAGWFGGKAAALWRARQARAPRAA